MNIALIGASEKPSLSKRLFLRLKKGGFEVVPVNPSCGNIEGISCFHSLSDLPQVPKVVIFMVNPQLSLKILEQVLALNVKKVWFQPGTFNDEVLQFCQKYGLQVEHEKCLLIAPLEHLQHFLD